MSLLNVGTRALVANQIALQTTGNNIANVSTPGYSRQSVALATVPGQYTGSGYIGQGVDVRTILRNQNELLTRQAAAAGSVQSSDQARSERLNQLQDIFSGGTSGLGASINDMMNALSDVVSAPTDLTARTLALTRMDETATRLRSSADRISEMQGSLTGELNNSVDAINNLATQIANVNNEVAKATGRGQSPNDLLDQRDQLIRDLNQYIQTTQIPADDGSVGVFIGGSQPLVLGSTSPPVVIDNATSTPGSGQLKLFFAPVGAPRTEMDENLLGGGSVSGLLRFNNSDLSEGRNLLGRMAMAIGMTMNDQHNLGLTLDGNLGSDLFSVPTSMPGYTAGVAAGTVAFTTPTAFAASDYEVRFTTPPAGQVVRLSDGKATSFTTLANLSSQTIDGLTFNMTAAGNAGERVLFKPFSSAASNIESLVHSPRDLAVANPINAAMGPTNSGSLQLAKLTATGVPNPPGFTAPPPTGVVLTFTAGPPSTYGVTGSTSPASGTTGLPYTSGQAINIDGWQVTLQGTPATGDTLTVGDATDAQYGDYYTRNAGNATALLALRDVTMFDGATLSDGYAGAIAQVGTRTQSANFAAELSSTIATNLERDRTAVSGVNLDEEAARLIQYQQAYQASAKMIQIAQSVFDTLLSISR